MLYIGVDPGAIYSGIAVYATSKNRKPWFSFWSEHGDPVVIARWIRHQSNSQKSIVVLENMIGGGFRDSNIVKTIKIVGFIQYYCSDQGIKCELVNPQARLAFVSLVPPEIHGKDEKSAAAHAMAFYDKLEERSIRAANSDNTD